MPPLSRQHRRSVHTGIACALAGSIAFSGKPVLVKAAYQFGVDTTTLLALRMLFAAPLFMLMAWWAGRPTTAITGREIIGITALGFLGYYLGSFLDLAGLQYISAGFGRLILYLYPTLVLLMSAAFQQQPLRRQQLASLLLSYAGIALVFSATVPAATKPDAAAAIATAVEGFEISKRMTVFDRAQVLYKAAQIIKDAHEQYPRLVVITSAMSGVTDLLLKSATLAAQGQVDSLPDTESTLRQKHFSATDALIKDEKRCAETKAQIDSLIQSLVDLCRAIAVRGEASPRALDAVGSLGERMSVPLLVAVSQEAGVKVKA